MMTSGIMAVGAAGLFTVSLFAGQQAARPAQPMTGHEMPMPMTSTAKPGAITKAQKIANAMTAAPSSISAKATILDWPAKDGEAPEVLRKGTNGWSCFPDSPETKGNDPVCADSAWLNLFEAYLTHKTPAVPYVSVAYMIAPGGSWLSNTEPYAMTETADHKFAYHPPHLMIAVPDSKSLAGLPTDPSNGGPYVMWANTPYAHIMVPTTAPEMGKTATGR
jgi:hypothetical protein